MSFTPYLAFNGNCREAFTAYARIFGGNLVLLGWGDAPPGAMPEVDERRDGVMHAALRFGDRSLLGADDPTGGFDGRVRGMCVSYSLADRDRAKQIFDALSEGGVVQMPLGETFYSPAFGMCVDRFGTPWMIVTEPGDG